MIPDAPNNTLAGFVLSTFKDWKTNRAPLEKRWTTNLNAFKNISDGVWKKNEGKDWRSNTFIGKTKQKCVAAYSMVVNILLRDGKLPFMITPANDFPEGSPEDTQEEDYSKEMQKLIDDQLFTVKADRVLMKNILCCAVLGESYQKKGIIYKNKKNYAKTAALDGSGTGFFEMKTEQVEYPNIEYISPFNIYRDLESDDMKTSAGIIHHDFVSPFWLRSQKDIPYFKPDAIDKIIHEYAQGTTHNTSDVPSPAMKEVSKRKKTIPYFEFWGRVPKKAIEDYEKQTNADIQPDVNVYENDGNEIECLVCVAGNEVVRYFRTDDPDERPFLRGEWQADLEGIGGIGVPDSTNDKQLLLNGVTRSFEDNKKLSGNVIIATKDRLIDGEVDEVEPGLRIHITEECKDAREAMQSIIIPDVGSSLLELITMVERWFDEDSNIPKISQGISIGNNATAYETSKTVESSGKYISGIIRNFDEGFIEPDIEYLYHYNMSDPACKVKGNYKVKPMGYIEYQNSFEKIMAMNQIFGLIQSISVLTQNPELSKVIRVRNIIEQACRATRNINPDEIIITEKELALQANSPEGLAEAQAIVDEEKQKQEFIELDKQAKLAEIRKLEAETQLALARVQNETTGAKTKVADTMGKLHNQQEQIKIQLRGEEKSNAPVLQ